jgi:hypothetical protein
MAASESNNDPEFVALATIHDALRGLDVAAQERVIGYQTTHAVFGEIRQRWNGTCPKEANRLHLGPLGAADQVIDDASRVLEIQQNWRKLIGVEMETYVIQKLGLAPRALGSTRLSDVGEAPLPNSSSRSGQLPPGASAEEDGLEGISPLARKWMVRNGLSAEQLSQLFSLGADEIDLVASTVPGTNKRDRARTVLLLKAMAAYLSSGAARVTHEQIKEACLHYDAYDSANHAKSIKLMVAEASGNKESGYTLTARGMTAATEIIKEMLHPQKGK